MPPNSKFELRNPKSFLTVSPVPRFSASLACRVPRPLVSPPIVSSVRVRTSIRNPQFEIRNRSPAAVASSRNGRRPWRSRGICFTLGSRRTLGAHLALFSPASGRPLRSSRSWGTRITLGALHSRRALRAGLAFRTPESGRTWRPRRPLQLGQGTGQLVNAGFEDTEALGFLELLHLVNRFRFRLRSI